MKSITHYLFSSLSIVLWCSCSQPKTTVVKESKAVPDSVVSHVQVASVRNESMDEYIKLNGKIQPNEMRQAKVFALVSGKIESISVELGDFVHKGQLLAVLKSTEVADVSNTLSLAESNVAIAKKGLETTKDLYEGQLATEQEYLNATMTYNNALSELNRAKEVASITGGSNSSYLVKAPLSGYVIDKNISNNSEVRQDNNEDLFAIADLSNVWIIANVYEADINKVHIDDEVAIQTLANPEKTYAGKINKIYNVLDPETRTMRVRISIDNPEGELKPEMFATVRVKVRSAGIALMVPSQAIIMDNSKYYVVVREKSKLSIKEVVIIKRAGNKTFISGLAENEEVVTNSQVFLFQALNTN
ncbi:MAG: efflux RND transporter periplasmic adaptor subunit [Cytophaga sp.]|nr:efflux RND transporter periplasmic adaptor subunit [Cytophaga sp.]